MAGRGKSSDPGALDDLIPELRLVDALQQRPSGIGTVWQVLRVAVAVTVSWGLAYVLSQSSLGIFAPITTLLVVSTSPWSTLGLSVQRILGTGAGVLLASLWVNAVGTTWWSVLVAVLVALLIARLLPMSIGGQFQIPVAVIFVMAIGPGTVEQDLWRILDVGLGGLVGLLAVFLPPTRPKPERFERALREYRDAILDGLADMGREVGSYATPLPTEEHHRFIAATRAFRDRSEAARRELALLAESVRFNPRGRAVRDELADDAIRLRRLSGIGLQVRGLAGAANRLYDRAGDPPALGAETLDSLLAEVAGVATLALGEPGDPVRPVTPEPAEQASEVAAQRIREVADEIASGVRAGGVVESIGVLGRLIHVVDQLRAFARGVDPEDEDG